VAIPIQSDKLQPALAQGRKEATGREGREGREGGREGRREAKKREKRKKEKKRKKITKMNSLHWTGKMTVQNLVLGILDQHIFCLFVT